MQKCAEQQGSPSCLVCGKSSHGSRHAIQAFDACGVARSALAAALSKDELPCADVRCVVAVGILVVVIAMLVALSRTSNVARPAASSAVRHRP